ncbi:hypothetical protein Salat_1698200 [Sesamum alatum]|uniref:Uncharacterized protein n=1 Tax=Sesamum alatum TaxID=300844 RepID=A0AAE2CK25_9LAMI|nr:hypothetical protein Salat_1698200 [Sesamum alatum]
MSVPHFSNSSYHCASPAFHHSRQPPDLCRRRLICLGSSSKSRPNPVISVFEAGFACRRQSGCAFGVRRHFGSEGIVCGRVLRLSITELLGMEAEIARMNQNSKLMEDEGQGLVLPEGLWHLNLTTISYASWEHLSRVGCFWDIELDDSRCSGGLCCISGGYQCESSAPWCVIDPLDDGRRVIVESNLRVSSELLLLVREARAYCEIL